MDLAQAFLVVAILFPLVLTAFLLLRWPWRPVPGSEQLSPVSVQHIQLFQGARLNESVLESMKVRYRDMLERGELSAIEASLKPGTQYVVKVRALAEIGTDVAGRILEQQLQRRLTDDRFEQAWYWIDLASSLRGLNREASLPYLLRCAESSSDLPLGHFFAAETICFLSFRSYLQSLDGPLGQAALRVLHRALEGMRYGVPPQVMTEGKIGEIVETLWDNRPAEVHPLVVRIFVEVLRLLRRAPHAAAVLDDEMPDQEGFSWQLSRLEALEGSLKDYLKDAPKVLCDALAANSASPRQDVLAALTDLRAETAPVLLPLLEKPRLSDAEAVFDALAWSHDPRVGPALRHWTAKHVPVVNRAQRRRRARPPMWRGLPAHIPYQAVLRAMRGHPSRETEAFLLLAARDFDPRYRAAAFGSLGWWEPQLRSEVLLSVREAKHDPNPDVRQAARAALARLGERGALQWFRQALKADKGQRVHEAIQVIAHEGLMLLYPDLDRLADSPNVDVAFHAREAIERMFEEMERKT